MLKILQHWFKSANCTDNSTKGKAVQEGQRFVYPSFKELNRMWQATLDPYRSMRIHAKSYYGTLHEIVNTEPVLVTNTEETLAQTRVLNLLDSLSEYPERGEVSLT